MTADRMKKAKNLKMCLTAGIGSDHIDLDAAAKHNITVAEVTFCNSISVAEHVVMQILALVRNYIPSYQTIVKGGWNIADCVERCGVRSVQRCRTFGLPCRPVARHGCMVAHTMARWPGHTTLRACTSARSLRAA